MARVYDTEILPLWSERFGRMLLRDLELPKKAMVLEVGCATGYIALKLLDAMQEGQGRVIALEPIGTLLDVAREKAGALSGKRIYFRTEAVSSELGFADEVYDVVISNLGLLEVDDPQRTLQEFARVTRTDGRVLVTLPLAGSFSEFYDIYREVLIRNDLNEVLAKLEQHIARDPEPEDAACWMENAGLKEVDVEVAPFRLLFRSSREFFFAPVIEYGPLGAWKELAGKGPDMQDVFWQIKESIDHYFTDRAFEITVRAACLRGLRPAELKLRDPLPIGAGSTAVAEALEEVTRSGLIEGETSASFARPGVLLPEEEANDTPERTDPNSTTPLKPVSGSHDQAGTSSNGEDVDDDEVTRPRVETT
jgi:ubiquinone/menaquinone biosynthesis C-methylase UbiE